MTIALTLEQGLWDKTIVLSKPLALTQETHLWCLLPKEAKCLNKTFPRTGWFSDYCLKG